MGMPVKVQIPHGTKDALEAVFAYFVAVDKRFSTYKEDSEISKINAGFVSEAERSEEMQEVFVLSEKTKEETRGFFSIVRPDGLIDPSGLVKGWSIRNAAKLVEMIGYKDYFLNVGGDIQSGGVDEARKPWTVGIRNPFKREEVVKVLRLDGRGVATSGNYIRGNHIYNPHNPKEVIEDVASLTVIGPDIYEADRFATAAFAMGKEGINFIEQLPGFEGYMIDKEGIATMSTNFNNFVVC